MKARTTLEIDSDLLRKTMELYGCYNKTKLIDLLLREAIRHHGRMLLLEDMKTGQTYELPGYEDGVRADREREERLERLRND